MRKLPWKWISRICGIGVLLVAGRAAVTIGRARYWGTDWLSDIREDPWIYVGFALAAIGIIAWTLSPIYRPQPEAAPADEAAAPAEAD